MLPGFVFSVRSQHLTGFWALAVFRDRLTSCCVHFIKEVRWCADVMNVSVILLGRHFRFKIITGKGHLMSCTLVLCSVLDADFKSIKTRIVRYVSFIQILDMCFFDFDCTYNLFHWSDVCIVTLQIGWWLYEPILDCLCALVLPTILKLTYS